MRKNPFVDVVLLVATTRVPSGTPIWRAMWAHNAVSYLEGAMTTLTFDEAPGPPSVTRSQVAT